ncbi:MAG TPA: hypothetical protein VI977_05815 [archaeon]|nr:hypothetical protein [archaeon]
MTGFWDFLRPLDQLALNLVYPITAIVFVVSVVLFAIAISAYLKKRSQKLLLISAAFFIFMVKWLLQAIDLFVSPGFFFSVPSQGVVELVIMLLILAAIVKK